MTWGEVFPTFMSDRRILNLYLLNGTRSDTNLDRSVFKLFFLADTSDTVHTHYPYSHPFKCFLVTSG